MNHTRLAAGFALLLMLPGLHSTALNAQPDAMSLAKTALGGVKALDDVRTIRGVGTLLRLDRTLSYVVSAAFPTQYRVDYSGSLQQTIGFNREGLIRPYDSTFLTGQDIVNRNTKDLRSSKRDASLLMLGMFLKPLPDRNLTFTPGSPATIGSTPADVVRITGDDNFSARLYLDRSTHLPLRISWDGVDIVWPENGIPVGDRQQMEAALAKLQVVRHDLILTNRKTVSGINIPFTIAHESGGRVYEKITFETVELNPFIESLFFATQMKK